MLFYVYFPSSGLICYAALRKQNTNIASAQRRSQRRRNRGKGARGIDDSSIGADRSFQRKSLLSPAWRICRNLCLLPGWSPWSVRVRASSDNMARSSCNRRCVDALRSGKQYDCSGLAWGRPKVSKSERPKVWAFKHPKRKEVTLELRLSNHEKYGDPLVVHAERWICYKWKQKFNCSS